MRRLGSLFHTAMNGMSAAKTMFRILDAPVPPRGERELDGRGDIVCRGVGYSYGEGGARGEHVVLDQVNCSMRRGSLVAIVGESGSGKSTLAGILSGRKASYLGKLEVGGVDVRDATLDSLMRAVTLVPTAGHLFAGSLRSNLLLARPDATDRDLMDVLERCRIAGFVRANGGLDMELAEGGANLSGGQRQRVCVARALLHDSPIYIFDEATSNVDVESERAIGRVIDELAGDHTVIAIAHRLASVAHADQTLVFSRGHLVEQGAHAQLLAAGGIYASMWSSQHELSAYALDEENERASMPAGTVVDAAALESGPAPVQASHAAAGAPSSCGPRRSAFSIMARMIGLVRPLAPHLALAVALGTAGSLAATFVAAFGAYGIMAAVGQGAGLSVAAACVLTVACGVLRGPLHYGEQLANHYIAFRLLALIRDHVFAALRRLAPAKLEGRDRARLDIAGDRRYRAARGVLRAHHLAHRDRHRVLCHHARVHRRALAAAGCHRPGGLPGAGRNHAHRLVQAVRKRWQGITRCGGIHQRVRARWFARPCRDRAVRGRLQALGWPRRADRRHGLHGPFPARALRCGRGPGGYDGAAHQPRHDRDVVGALRRGRPLVLVRVHLLLCVPVLLWPGAGGVPSGHVPAGDARLWCARARSFGRGAPDRGRARWRGCFL